MELCCSPALMAGMFGYSNQNNGLNLPCRSSGTGTIYVVGRSTCRLSSQWLCGSSWPGDSMSLASRLHLPEGGLSVLSRKADPLNNADWVLVGGPSYHRGPNVGYQLPFCSSGTGRSQCRRDDLNVVGRFSLSTEHFMALLFISVPAWVLLGVPAYHRASCSLD